MFPKIKEKITKSPNLAGIYQFLDQNSQVLYVGKAKNLKNRLKSYQNDKNLSVRIKKMISYAKNLEIITTQTESEALLLECNLIKKFRPRYNILLRDDKSFSYIFISDDEFAQIGKYRGKKVKKGHYFGPFASILDINKTIDVIKKSFLLRSCSNSEFSRRKKPCLEYQIKRCSAPCVGFIEKSEYDKLVFQALNFFKGKNGKIQENLAQKMQFFSENLQYEKATIIRDRIKALSSIQAKQNINLLYLKNSDIISFAKEDDMACINISFYRLGHNYGSKSYFININSDQNDSEIISSFLGQFYLDQNPPENIILSHKLQNLQIMEEFLSNLAKKIVKINIPSRGNKLNLIKDQLKIAQNDLKIKLIETIKDKNLLIRLKELLNLPKIPQRIEIYDNSHISGQYMVGAMVVAGIEGFIKNSYRKFNIKTQDLDKKDDTAMLKQVLRRRFSKNKEKDYVKPDLIIVDGGKGQLSAVKTVFSDLKIIDQDYICMSKGPNRNAGEEFFHQIGQQPKTLPKTDPLMYYLQRLRDEAHRFAIGSHRKKRAKSVSKSELDDIKDIGKGRKMALLNHFGSTSAIKEAGLEDLCRVDGISKAVAKKVYCFFN